MSDSQNLKGQLCDVDNPFMSLSNKRVVVGVLSTLSLLTLGSGYYVLSSGPTASVRVDGCGGFFVDTGERAPGLYGSRRLLGFPEELPSQGLGEIDGEVRGDTFYGPDGYEVDVFWEPHDGIWCEIESPEDGESSVIPIE